MRLRDLVIIVSLLAATILISILAIVTGSEVNGTVETAETYCISW